MALRVQILHLTIVGPFVGHIESGAQRTTVGVDASFLEQIVVQLLVEIVDRVIEGEQHQLGHRLDGHVAFDAMMMRYDDGVDERPMGMYGWKDGFLFRGRSMSPRVMSIQRFDFGSAHLREGKQIKRQKR